MEFVLGGITFPLTPSTLTVATAAQMKTWDILDLGEVVFPRGRQATKLSFAFTLPGSARTAYLPGVATYWQEPEVIAASFTAWTQNGTPQTFIVTDTGINLTVLVQTFSYAPGGGYGDFECQIALVEQRSVSVTTVAATSTAASSAAGSSAAGAVNPYRSQPAPPTSYLVQAGDTLSSIAKLVLGDQSQWQALYNANVGVIGPDALAPLVPGTKLVIPGST